MLAVYKLRGSYEYETTESTLQQNSRLDIFAYTALYL